MDKLYQMEDGTWVGFTGSADGLGAWVHWYHTGEAPPQPVDATVLAVKGRTVAMYIGCTPPVRLRGAYHAIGSGAACALAAMDAGADAVKAVRIACKRDIYSGGRVRSVKV